jgi:hypothetical protein
MASSRHAQLTLQRALVSRSPAASAVHLAKCTGSSAIRDGTILIPVGSPCARHRRRPQEPGEVRELTGSEMGAPEQITGPLATVAC